MEAIDDSRDREMLTLELLDGSVLQVPAFGPWFRDDELLNSLTTRCALRIANWSMIRRQEYVDGIADDLRKLRELRKTSSNSPFRGDVYDD